MGGDSNKDDKVLEKQSSLEVDLKADETKVQPLKSKLLKYVEDAKFDRSECYEVCDDDDFIRRCLISSHNDSTKAYKLGVSCMKFRNDYKPRSIRLEDFPTAASQNLMFMTKGYAIQNNWPVILGKAKNWNPWKYTTDEYIKMVAYMLECGEQAMNPDQPLSRMYIVLNLKDQSLFYNDIRKIRWFAKITSELYPERCIGVGINADLVSTIMWNILSPLLDKRTRDGVVIFRPGGGGQNWLEENIGMAILPPSLGGNLEDEFPPVTQEIVDSYRWDNDSTIKQRAASSGPEKLTRRQTTAEESMDNEAEH